MSFFSLGIPPSLDDHTSKISIAVQMRPTLTQVKQLLRSGPVRQQIYLGIGSAARGEGRREIGGDQSAMKKRAPGPRVRSILLARPEPQVERKSPRFDFVRPRSNFTGVS